METQFDERNFRLLAAMPSAFRALAAEFEAAPALAAPRSPWGVKECVAHVLDVAEIAFVSRIGRIVTEENPFIRSIDPSARLETEGYLLLPIESLLDELDDRRARDVAWLRSIPREAFARTGTHDRAGTLSAADIANYWAFHDLTHVRQAAKALQDELIGRLGNTRLFIEEV